MPPQNGIPVDLKSLLAKWKLECVLTHLLDEKIDIEVFEMMKLSHIGALLQNFPFGIQIRFEYYLERWREEIGKPFQLSTNDGVAKCLFKAGKTKIEMESKSTQTDLIIYTVSPASPSHNSINKDAEDPTATRMQTTVPQLSSGLSSATLTPLPVDEVDLLVILRNAACGLRLITSYGMRQSFTDKERKLLIETIVDHYIDNKMKFNVPISYALEQAVLKMFPSEKLSSYRTAKLGRIYITYVSFRAKQKAKEKELQVTDTTTTGANATTNEQKANENCKEVFQITDDHVMIRDNATTAEIDMIDVSHEVSGESAMSDNTESIVFTIENSDEEDETEENPTRNKFDADEVDLTATLDSAILIRKMLSRKRQRIEEIDGPFINFSIPWDKVPRDLIGLLENGQQLGRRLNVFANLIVDELRKVSTRVPMRVLRAVSQQAIMKYPHTFLDKDAEGNLKPSTTSPLLSRLRNRNTFLNRQDR